MRRLLMGAAIAGLSVLASTQEAEASSHREAPFVTKNPKIDSTDFYMFRSYEGSKADTVTIIANYLPLQDSYGGPNYFELDPEALYEIHIDNTGDGVEDVTFQFQFHHALNGANGLQVPITLLDDNDAGVAKTNSVPLLNIGGVGIDNTANLNVLESYDLNMVTGDRRTGAVKSLGTNLKKPADFIGTATYGSAATYENYARAHIHDVALGACGGARVFVGQRREGFAGNIGVIFDLVQGPALGPGGGIAGIITGGGTAAGRGYNGANPNDTGLLYNKNVTSIAMEVPIACLKGAGDVIGGWTSASMRQARVLNPGATYTVPSKEGGAWTQVSRLGMPLVNEVVIGLKDKDNFGASPPKDDAKFADYITHPTLAKLLEILYGAASPAVREPNHVRTDLVGVFATGLTVKTKDNADFNLNQTSTGPGNPGPAGNALPAAIAEMVRLNVALPATSKTDQIGKGEFRGLGALGCFNDARQLDTDLAGCDPAGFPNGRRPGDDTIDIALRVVMGALFGSDTVAPARNIPFTDANFNGPEQFDDKFPYLRTPLAGNNNPYNPSQL